MTPESTDHPRTTLEDIPDNLGLGEFDVEPHGHAGRGGFREYVANPATDGAPTYRVLSPSDPVATVASIETRRPVRLTLGQRVLDRVGRVGLVALEKGVALAAVTRPHMRIRIDQSAAVATALAVAVVGYGALYLLVWDRPMPPQSHVATRMVPTAAAAPVATRRPPALVETAAPTLSAVSASTPTARSIPTKSATSTLTHAVKAAPTTRPVTTPAARVEPSRERVIASSPAPGVAIRDALPQPLPEPKVEEPAPGPQLLEPRRAETEVAAARPAGAPAVAATPGRAGVDEVLAAYRDSYNTLDATSVLRVWDGADQRALQRAFSSLKQQRVAFDSCHVDITSAARALAHCTGVLSYVPKYGNGSEQRRPMEWTIYLQQHDGGWRIASVAAREDAQGRRE